MKYFTFILWNFICAFIVVVLPYDCYIDYTIGALCGIVGTYILIW